MRHVCMTSFTVNFLLRHVNFLGSPGAPFSINEVSNEEASGFIGSLINCSDIF